jgi:cytidine deaminase
MEKKDREYLLGKAKEVRKNSYSPYSGFSVGAALLCEDGKVYIGCNVENSAFSPTCCAERAAVFSAVADGHRRFSAIAIAANKAPCMPCGVCRQVLSEFCAEDFIIIYEGADGGAEQTTLGELLPYSFRYEEKK